jgi:foldase protein PrsA
MRRLAILVMPVALLAVGCGDLLDPAAAVVGGKKITVEMIESELERFERSPEFERLAEQGDAQEIKRQVEQQLLTQQIRRAVLEPKAEEFGVEVTAEEIGDRLDQVKADFDSEGAFQETLKEQGLTLQQLEQLITDQLLEEQLRAEVTEDVAPSEEELRAYYEENLAQFEQTEASHILVPEKAEAQDLARRLQAAPGDEVQSLFEELARRFSTDPSADQGGELGTFAPGEFVPPFERAAADLDLGEVSDAVRTEFGWHVILVTDRTVATFEEVQAQIEAELSQGTAEAEWNDFVSRAYEEADVKVNPRYGEFDEEAFQVVDPTAEDVPGAEVPDSEPSAGLQPEASPEPAS